MESNQALGVLLGLACGDALGRPVEFSSAAAIKDEHGRLDEIAVVCGAVEDWMVAS